MPQQVTGNANSWDSSDLGGKEGEALLRELFAERWEEISWKDVEGCVASIAGSMIERVKLWGGENTSTFTSLKRRMKCCFQTLEEYELGENLCDGSSFIQMFLLGLVQKEGFV